MSLETFLKGVKKDLSKANNFIIYDESRKLEFIKTGCLPFDLFVGGFPKRALSEVFGAEHSGKSSLMYSTAAEIQKNKKSSIYLDFETAFNASFAKSAFNLVVDNKTFTLLQPNNAEEGADLLDRIEAAYSDSKEPLEAIFIDSIAAIQSRASIASSLEDNQRVGEHARTVGRIVNKLRGISAKFGCAIIMINQTRAALNLNPYGSKSSLGNMNHSDDTTTGGKAPRFYSALRVRLSNTVQKETTMDPTTGQLTKNIIVGNVTKFEIIKNKVGVPFLKFVSHFDLNINGQVPGWNEIKDIVHYLESFKLIEQASVRFSYHGSSDEFNFSMSGKKEDSIKAFLQRPDLIEDGKKQILSRFSSKKEVIIDSSLEALDDSEVIYDNEVAC